jgi:iron complex outermembrane recepter protein
VVHWKAINRTSYYKNDFAAELEVGYQSNLRHEWSPYVPHGYMPPNAHTIPNTPQNLERMFDKSTLSGNIGASWHWDNGQELKWGLQTEHQQNTTEGWSFIIPMFKQLTGGTYLFGKRKLSEQWTLNGAIRGDVGKIEVSQYNDWFATPLPSSTGTDSLVFLERSPNATRRFSSVVWSVGAVFDQAPYLLKMNVGKSFRMPIAKELGANGVNYHNFSYERGNINLNAEQSYQVDMSMQINKAGWAVQVSPFFNVFPNYIYLNPTPQYDYLYGAGNQVFDYTQASVMRYGSELHAHVNLTEWLQTGVVGEWVYSLQTSGDKQGFTLPFSPPPSLILNLRADVKPWGITRKSYLSADVKLVGPQNRIVPPEKPTDGYTTLALSAGGQLKVGNQWVSINAQVLNLLNTKYYNHTSYYRLIDLPEAGRNIIVNLTIPFTLINNAL